MQRIDNPPDNQFTNGDPEHGVTGTVVTGQWLNAVQEEIATVIGDAKIVLDEPGGAVNDQLLAALNKLYGRKSQIYHEIMAMIANLGDEHTDLEEMLAELETLYGDTANVGGDLYLYSILGGL
jgi:hypothetical protein